MRRIIEFARNSTSSKLEVYRADVGHLEIRRQAGMDVMLYHPIENKMGGLL